MTQITWNDFEKVEIFKKLARKSMLTNKEAINISKQINENMVNKFRNM